MEKMLRYLIIVVILVNASASDERATVKSVHKRSVYEQLRSKYMGGSVLDAMFNNPDLNAKYKGNVTEEETLELDNALSQMFPFGGPAEYYITSMDEYCGKLADNFNLLKSFVGRKYKYNIIVKVAISLVITKLNDKNVGYCSSIENQDAYLKNLKKVKDINHKLKPFYEDVINTAVEQQKKSFSIRQTGKICCAFWRFYDIMDETVKGKPELQFALDMTVTYFGAGAKYVCPIYSYGSTVCKEMKERQQSTVIHEYHSILLNMIMTFGRITTISA